MQSSQPHMLCCAQSLSSFRLFTAPWTVAHLAPLSMGILQARIPEWVAMPFSRGSSQPRDQTQVSCMAGGFFTRSEPPRTVCSHLHFLQRNTLDVSSSPVDPAPPIGLQVRTWHQSEKTDRQAWPWPISSSRSLDLLTQ